MCSKSKTRKSPKNNVWSVNMPCFILINTSLICVFQRIFPSNKINIIQSRGLGRIIFWPDTGKQDIGVEKKVCYKVFNTSQLWSVRMSVCQYQRPYICPSERPFFVVEYKRFNFRISGPNTNILAQR